MHFIHRSWLGTKRSVSLFHRLSSFILIFFGLSISSFAFAASVIRGPYLQMGSEDSLSIR